MSEFWPEPKFSSNVVLFCPICNQNNLNTKLKLYQINLTTAVYLCQRKGCIYPNGYGWTYVERNIDDMIDSDINFDTPNSETNSHTSVGCSSQENEENLMDELDRMISEISNSTHEDTQPSNYTDHESGCTKSLNGSISDLYCELDLSDIVIDNKNIANTPKKLDGFSSENIHLIDDSFIAQILDENISSQDRIVVENNAGNMNEKKLDLEETKTEGFIENQTNGIKCNSVTDAKESSQNFMEKNNVKQNKIKILSIMEHSCDSNDSAASASEVYNKISNQCHAENDDSIKDQNKLCTDVLNIPESNFEIRIRNENMSILKENMKVDNDLKEKNIKVDLKNELENNSCSKIEKLGIAESHSNIKVKINEFVPETVSSNKLTCIEKTINSEDSSSNYLSSQCMKDLQDDIAFINLDAVKTDRVQDTNTDVKVRKRQNKTKCLPTNKQVQSLDDEKEINCKKKPKRKQRTKKSSVQPTVEHNAPVLNLKDRLNTKQKSCLSILKAISVNKKTAQVKPVVQKSLFSSEKNTCNLTCSSNASSLNSSELSKKFEPFTFTL